MPRRGSLETVGVALVLGGGLILRQVAVGRGQSVGPDLRDLATAVFTGDMAAATQVTARRGQNLPNTTIADAAAGAVNAVKMSAAIGASTLAEEMHRLAVAANNRYVWGATGPDGYDCSGLVWRACKNLGYYTGPRFTTYDWPNVGNGWTTRDSKQTVGDIVVWPNNPGHMGVVVGSDAMFSALSRNTGIVTSPISATHGEPPQYYTIRSPATASTTPGLKGGPA